MSRDIHQRDWGQWEILAEKAPHVKVKELTIEPGGALSFQKHSQRNEHWFVLKGKFKSKNLFSLVVDTLLPVAEKEEYPIGSKNV